MTAEHSDGNEAELVSKLRRSESYVPELSLVAVAEGKIIGHILFTKVEIGGCAGLALAPLAVLPQWQRKGVGTMLIKEGHKVARRLGYTVSVVLGSPDYYMRHGYSRADTMGITAPFEVEPQYFMACALGDDSAVPQGTVRYDAAFGI